MDRTESKQDEMIILMADPLFPTAMREWIAHAPLPIIADFIRYSSTIMVKRLGKESQSKDFAKKILD
jgi:hypothetical protein